MCPQLRRQVAVHVRRGRAGAGVRPRATVACMGPGSTQEVAARCARVAEEADALAARVRGLPPPTWTGPAADELGAGLGHAVRLIDEGADAVRRAGVVARSVGEG